MPKFESIGQVGSIKLRNDLVLLEAFDVGNYGYWLRASKMSATNKVLDSSVVFISEILDKTIKFSDIIADARSILSEAKTELGRIGIIRSPKKGTVDLYYIKELPEGTPVIKSEDYEITVADDTIFANATLNDVTITLPASPDQGQIIKIKCIGLGIPYTCIIARNGNLIDDIAADVTLQLKESLTLQYDSTYGWGKV